MRKVAVAAAVALTLVGAGLAVLPFDRPHPPGSLTYGPGIATRCSAPVVAAWRVEHDAGWFGYAPLTSTPLSLPTCRGAARHRLVWGCWWLGGAVLLTLVLRRHRRDAGTADAPTVP